MLEREEAPGAPDAGLHLVADEQRARLAAQRLRALQVVGRRQVHALALDRLDDERRHVAARELALERVAGRRTATGSQPGSSGPKPSRNSSLPLIDSEPSVSPWKACSAYSTRGRPVAARAILIAASTASVPVFAGTIAATLSGRAREQLLGEHAAQQRHAELRQVAGARRHHLLHRRDRLGVVAPDREHAVAAEQVEVALAVARRSGARPRRRATTLSKPSVRRIRPICGFR